jgi:intracellular septation protein
MPAMNLLLDLIPAIAFIAAYSFGDIYAATLALIASLVVTVLLHRLLLGRWNKGQLVTLLVSVVLGGVTLALHDPGFIKLKPSVVYGVFALALLGSQLAGEKVLLQRLPQKMLVMPDVVWKRVNFAWGLFFILLAVLNYYVAHHFDEATWVKFKVFGFTLLMIIFMLAHLPFLGRYVVNPDESGT